MTRTSRRRRLVRRRVRTVSCFLDTPRTPDLRAFRDWYQAVEGAIDLGWTPEAIIENIGRFQNQALVTAVIEDGHDYRNVVVGAHWQTMHGRDVTNTLLSQYPNPEVREKTRILFNQIIHSRRALFIDTPPIAARRVHRSKGLEMAFMPLRGRNGKVTHLITAVPHYQSIFGTR
ncbi:MAG: hypothetical protein WAW96_17075 [Alphaproteobacteria bacterium]